MLRFGERTVPGSTSVVKMVPFGSVGRVGKD